MQAEYCLIAITSYNIARSVFEVQKKSLLHHFGTGAPYIVIKLSDLRKNSESCSPRSCQRIASAGLVSISAVISSPGLTSQARVVPSAR